MFDHKYPYTNLHEMNLDWLIEQMTNLINDFSSVKVGFEEVKEQFTEISEKFEGFDTAFEAFKTEVTQQFNILSSDFAAQFEALKTDIQSQLDGVDDKIEEFKTEVNGNIDAFKNEVNQDIIDIQDDFEDYKEEVDDKIEHLDVTPAVNARIDELVQDGTIQGMAYEVVGDKWNATTDYIVGDYVIHNNVFFKCIQDNTNEEPETGDYWEATSVANELLEVATSGRNEFHVTTEEIDFEGLEVTATLVDSPEGLTEEHSATITNGFANIPFKNIGTWQLSITESGEEYTVNQVVEYYSTYIIEFVKENATINISTPDSQLFNKPVRIDNGSSIITGILSSTGTLTKKLRQLGTYTITCTDPAIGSRVPAVQVNVTEFRTYDAVLRYQYATITVKTSETSLLGKTITATCEGTNYTGVFPNVLTQGYASVDIVVGKIGIYTISCESVTTSIEITEWYQTKETILSLITYLYNNGDECEALTGGWAVGQFLLRDGDPNLYKPVTKTNTSLLFEASRWVITRTNIPVSIHGDIEIEIETTGASTMFFVSMSDSDTNAKSDTGVQRNIPTGSSTLRITLDGDKYLYLGGFVGNIQVKSIKVV